MANSKESRLIPSEVDSTSIRLALHPKRNTLFTSDPESTGIIGLMGAAASVLAIIFTYSSFSSGSPLGVTYYPYLLTLFGLCALGAILIWKVSLDEQRKLERFRGIKTRYPNEPWRFQWDRSTLYGWDESQVQTKRAVSYALIFSLAWAAITWLFVRPGNFGYLVIVGLPVILLWIKVLHLTFHRLRFGQSYLVFESFPFYLGQTAEMRFCCKKGIGLFQSIRFTLRYVEQVLETDTSGPEPGFNIVCYQRWSQSYILNQAGEYYSNEGEVPISLQLPNLSLETRLMDRQPGYWQLDIHAQRKGLDYQATFLLPLFNTRSS